MMLPEEFEPVGDVTADDRGRIAIGKVVKPGDRFLMYRNGNGELLLVPHVLIPLTEYRQLKGE